MSADRADSDRETLERLNCALEAGAPSLAIPSGVAYHRLKPIDLARLLALAERGLNAEELLRTAGTIVVSKEDGIRLGSEFERRDVVAWLRDTLAANHPGAGADFARHAATNIESGAHVGAAGRK